MSYFARDVVRPGNGIVQRVGITIPLAYMMRLAWRLLREDRAGRRSRDRHRSS